MTGKVVIGIDPHKASWTAAAVDSSQRVLATMRVEVNRDGYRQLRRFARRFPHAEWAIEGAGGLGAPLVARLTPITSAPSTCPPSSPPACGCCPPGITCKTDQADAVSVAVAALTAQTLHAAEVDQTTAALRALTEHREDLVRARTQTVNRLHVLLAHLLPAGATGRGDVVAAIVLARTGPVSRFASSNHFASFAGVAPIEVSSGDVVRHRLSRAGDRQLNRALHVIAIAQIRRDTAGRAYYQRKRQAGKSHREALRCLKRRLADVVYRILLRDTNTPCRTTP